MPSIPEMFYGDAVSVVFTFFLGLGVFQLVWAAILLRSRNRLLLSVGVLGFLGSIVIYLVSLATPLPFGVKQQTITTFSAFPLTTKVIEAVFVVSSLSLLRRR